MSKRKQVHDDPPEPQDERQNVKAPEHDDSPGDEAGPDVDEAVQIEVAEGCPIDALGGGEELESLKRQLEEAEDRALRSQAELENFRRRARREIEDERRFANQPLLTDLFPVIDNIDRAIEAASQNADASGLLEGFRMVAQQLADLLAKHNCSRIEAAGQPFDPAVHEAISQMPSEEQPSGTVLHEALPGYQLHDRVIRPTQVVVSTGPNES